MPQIVIGVGSNINHEKNIRQALDHLTQVFGDILASPIYKSAPRHKAGGDDYYFNLVVGFDSILSVENIKASLRGIEQQQLRERNTGTVTIDLDLLLYGSWVGSLDGNNVPHDDITQCEFVLRPLADLLPEAIHPVIGDSYASLWRVFQPQLALTPVLID